MSATSVTAYKAHNSWKLKVRSRWWIGTDDKVPNRPLILPTISCTWLVRRWYSGTSFLVGTAIWTNRTLSLQSGLSSKNFSKPRSFCGIPLIMSSLSTPNIIFLFWKRLFNSCILLWTCSDCRARQNLSGSMPIGNAATRVTRPLSSTPTGVPSSPNMRVQALTKCLA